MAREFEISAQNDLIWDRATDELITLDELIDALRADGYHIDEIIDALDAIGKYRYEARTHPQHGGATIIVEKRGTDGAD